MVFDCLECLVEGGDVIVNLPITTAAIHTINFDKRPPVCLELCIRAPYKEVNALAAVLPRLHRSPLSPMIDCLHVQLLCVLIVDISLLVFLILRLLLKDTYSLLQ